MYFNDIYVPFKNNYIRGCACGNYNLIDNCECNICNKEYDYWEKKINKIFLEQSYELRKKRQELYEEELERKKEKN